MKVKVIAKRKVIEKEIDLEYPYYLYFQDEYCLNDELHRVQEDITVVVKCGINFNQINIIETNTQDEYIVLNNLTTEEHFFEIYNMVDESIKKYLKK